MKYITKVCVAINVWLLLQAQLKETHLSADGAMRAKEEQAARLRDMEKKVRTLEQDLNQAQEVRHLFYHSVCVCIILIIVCVRSVYLYHCARECV